MLFNDLLDLLLLEVLQLVLLEEQLHGGTTTERLTLGVRGDGKGTTGG